MVLVQGQCRGTLGRFFPGTFVRKRRTNSHRPALTRPDDRGDRTRRDKACALRPRSGSLNDSARAAVDVSVPCVGPVQHARSVPTRPVVLSNLGNRGRFGGRCESAAPFRRARSARRLSRAPSMRVQLRKSGTTKHIWRISGVKFRRGKGIASERARPRTCASGDVAVGASSATSGPRFLLIPRAVAWPAVPSTTHTLGAGEFCAGESKKKK